MSILQARLRDGVAILDIEGRLVGGPETAEIQATVREALDEGRRKILLNLAGVPWANSRAIGAIVASYAAARSEGGDLKLCCASKRVEMILRAIILIPDLFRGFECETEALRSFAPVSTPVAPRRRLPGRRRSE